MNLRAVGKLNKPILWEPLRIFNAVVCGFDRDYWIINSNV